MQVKNTQPSIPNDFFDYLRQNLEKRYSMESMEREMITVLFVLAMKKSPHPKYLFKHWELYNYSKKYSPEQAITMCEDFIHDGLGYDMSFPEIIDIFKVAFPNKVAP